MKKYILIFVFIISLGCNNSTKKEYYSNGNLKSEFNMINEKLNKEYKIYYKSGKLKEKGYFLNGVKIDTTYKFYESGALSELNVFIAKNDFKVIKYDSLNNIYLKGRIKNNDSVGWWSYFYPNGNLKFKKEFWKVKDKILVNQYIKFNKKTDIDEKKSLYININDQKDILEYHSPYKNLSFGKDRFLWLMVIDTTSKSIYNDAIIDTLYPYNETSFYLESQKYYKGFIKEKVLIDTLVKEKKMMLIREINTFFNKAPSISQSKKEDNTPN